MTVQDLTGWKFGLLTVLAYSHSVKGAAKWFCICRCKGRRVCDGAELRSGRVQACIPCAKQIRRGRLVVAAQSRPPRTNDPDKLAALLDETGRSDYERWQKSCARLGYHITRTERLDVLRELVGGRKVA